MRYLLDTHLVIWANTAPSRLGPARAIIEDRANDIAFSVVNIWEIVIKRALGRADFQVDPVKVRNALLGEGCSELPVTASHVLAVGELPPLHRDPFDRLLVAQARAEGLRLLTADAGLGRYGEWVEVV